MAVPINYWALIVSVIAALVLGWIWFGPLFGKKWARLAGVSMESMQGHQASRIIINIVGAILMAVVLQHNLVFGSAYLHMTGIAAGLQGGFWNWLGFIAPVTVGAVLWEGKSWKIWFITAGYYLVSLLVMGMILASWL